MSFFEELKRRNVFRVGIAYGVAAWLLIQVSDTVFPRIGLPDSAVTLVIALLAIGFDRFEDTVFVRGGGGRDRPPRWSTLDAISGAFIDKRRAVLIDVAESNLDWHGARDNRPSSKPN